MCARTVVLAFLLALAAALALPLGAAAHALAVSSSPADGATVASAPKAVVITFGEIPDPHLSSIAVVDTSGTSVTSGPTTVVASHPAELEVPLKSLPDGAYTVTWRTISTVDGHLAAGSFAFGVGVSAAAADAKAHASVDTPPPSALAIAARWVWFMAALLLIGAVSTILYALRSIPQFAPRLIALSWVLAVAASFGVVESQREAAGVGWSAIFSTSLGGPVVERAVTLLVAGVAVLLICLRRTRGTAALAAVGVAMAAATWVDVASSHAGAQSPVAFNLAVQWLHLIAAGIWLGGLAVLLIAIRGDAATERHDAVRRFSTLAAVCIAVVGVSGLLRAFNEIPSWNALFHTTFGVLVIVKIALFVVLAVLGGFNRFRNVGRFTRSARGLRRVASTEVLIGIVVVLAAAGLVNVAPPATQLAASASAPADVITVSGHDFATTVNVTLTVTTGAPGFNTFNARVSNFDDGGSFSAQDVVLKFTQPLRPQLGESTLTLTRQSDGTFAAHGGNLSVAGIWRVVAIVESGVASTEVDLQLATNTPTPTVQTVPGSNGLPTLYTVALTKGRTVQVYLDPGKSGFNEFHMTFLDAKGAEFHVTRVTAGMMLAGGAPVALVTRQLDPVGHFVGDVPNLTAGKIRFDVIATTPSGEVLTTFLVISPLA